MPVCFVTQPFDKGAFDERYDDVVAPAIKAAKYEPYRVDRDPAVSIPIEEIERQISNADVCLIDITTDNPNVWYEFGFAIAGNKEICIICSAERKTPYPFNVQHRNVIRYETTSTRHFDRLKSDITARLQALSKKAEMLEHLPARSPLKEQEGLSGLEIAALAVIFENNIPNESIVVFDTIRRDMERLGINPLGARIAIEKLVRKKMVSAKEGFDDFSSSYWGYVVQSAGVDWLLVNEDKLQTRMLTAASTKAPKDHSDEIPF